MKFFNFQKTQRRQRLYKETRKVFISIILSSIMIGFPIAIAKDNEKFWVEFVQLRESKFGKDEQYLNKLSECRMIADNFLKIKKEEENFNKRVWAVSKCIKDYEAIMEVKKLIK